MNKNKNPILLTPWTHGPYYIFSIIENGIQLSKKTARNKIEINFLSFGFLKGIYSNFHIKLSRLISKNSTKKFDKRAIYKDIESGLLTKLHYSGVDIEILRIYPKSKEILISLWKTFKTLYRNKKYIIYFFLKREYLYKKMIEYKYNQIDIGILAASYSLRKEIYAGGELKKSSYYLLNFINAIYLVNISDLIINRIKPKFVSNNEQTYLLEILRKNCHNRGATVIEIDRFRKYHNNNLELYPPGSELLIKTILREGYYDLNEEEILEIKSKLKLRVEGKSSLWYQFNKSNKYQLPKTFLNDINKNSKGKLTVILFLHSVEDSQYIYGYDGFLDIVEWTNQSINTLLANNNIYKILIKAHPSINYKNNYCEKKFLKKLKNKFEQNSKIEFINPRIMNKEFKKIVNIFGVSHHGSVIEELSYLDISCISSYFAPWQNYPFIQLWNTVDEYLEILRDLSTSNFRTYIADRDLLFKYSFHYGKLNVEDEFWCRFYKNYFGFYPEKYNNEINKFDKILENITYDNKHLLNILDKIN